MLPNDRICNGIWVLAEVAAGTLTTATLELLGEAGRLAQRRATSVTAVVWGSGVSRFQEALSRAGADRVIMIDDSRFDCFHDEFQAETLRYLIRKYLPEILLAQASPIGRALIPRVASLCHAGLTADCTELDIDPATGALLQTRPAFGGALLATIRSDRFPPQMATVRPGVMRPGPNRPGFRAELIVESAPADRWSAVKRLLGEHRSGDDAPSFEHARIIVAGGRGVGGKAGFAHLKTFADAIGGVVGATRAAVDANWIGYGHQIGQTGRTVAPEIYIACGLSGQIQHLVGMQTSRRIVAINQDPEAPVMQMADLAIFGDLHAFIDSFLTSGISSTN